MERTALSFRTFRPDPASVGLYQMPRDGQPQPGAAAGAGPIGLVEALKNAFQVVVRDTLPGITYTKAYEILFGVHRQDDFTAWAGELDSVMNEINQHLFKAGLIRPDFGRILGRVEVQDQPGTFRLGAHAFGG